MRGSICIVNSIRAGIASQNLREVSKQTLGGVLPTVINHIVYKGDVSDLGFVKVNDWGALMVHELMRVTLKRINVLGG